MKKAFRKPKSYPQDRPRESTLVMHKSERTDIGATLKPVFASPFADSLDFSIYRDAVNCDISLHIYNALASSDYKSWPDSAKREARESLVMKADGM